MLHNCVQSGKDFLFKKPNTAGQEEFLCREALIFPRGIHWTQTCGIFFFKGVDMYFMKDPDVERENKQLTISFFLLIVFWVGLIFGLIVLLAPTVRAEGEAWTDDEIVEAIYKAEGGEKTKYPYGIRSVHCGSKADCRRICENTIKNNRRRYAEYGRREFASFIDFLSSRYCPTKGRTLTKAERNLNGNWTGNVRFFLAKNRGGK